MGYLIPAKLGGGSADSIVIYPPGTTFNNEHLEFEFTSTEAISAPRVVYAGASGPALADKDTISQQDKIIGITTTSAAGSGETVTVTTEGKLEDPSFLFSIGPIYLGTSGVITQTKPTSGLLLQLGVAISATQLHIRIEPAIKLA